MKKIFVRMDSFVNKYYVVFTFISSMLTFSIMLSLGIFYVAYAQGNSTREQISLFVRNLSSSFLLEFVVFIVVVMFSVVSVLDEVRIRKYFSRELVRLKENKTIEN